MATGHGIGASFELPAALAWTDNEKPHPKGDVTCDKLGKLNFLVIAAAVMGRHGIHANDLHGFIQPHLAKCENPNDCHFNSEGYELLGGKVAKKLLRLLPAR